MNHPYLNLMLLICPIHIIFENDSSLLPVNPQIKAWWCIDARNGWQVTLGIIQPTNTNIDSIYPISRYLNIFSTVCDGWQVTSVTIAYKS